ncbi:RHS repeat-associated core domain-containing protein [Sedimentibacter sp. zth1]|uniref:RHS repeat-associated core domain-containing protein n=1 Tax=Sedimentibacter sp. zth1 TaxID=2816908 RepID=UPI001A926367|nr:RHS repeat-associated core domain-containing protein [Sedimentibacter sp. zth1]QSX06723.1 RHS repeat-associated core domain-containing protein [Sedimentibacter sp. zth1]
MIFYRYDVSGNIQTGISVPCNLRGYTGHLYDDKASLVYMNARWYNPNIGRFMTEDTYRGNISNPQSLNQYAYALNNPVNYVDPTGHFAVYTKSMILAMSRSEVDSEISSMSDIWFEDYDIFLETGEHTEKQNIAHQNAELMRELRPYTYYLDTTNTKYGDWNKAIKDDNGSRIIYTYERTVKITEIYKNDYNTKEIIGTGVEKYDVTVTAKEIAQENQEAIESIVGSAELEWNTIEEEKELKWYQKIWYGAGDVVKGIGDSVANNELQAHAIQLDQLRSTVGKNDEKYSSGMSQGLQSFESNIIVPNVTYDGCYNVGKKVGDVISFGLGLAETGWGVIKTGASAVVGFGGSIAKLTGREAIAEPAISISVSGLASGALSIHGGLGVVSASWDNLTSGSEGTRHLDNLSPNDLNKMGLNELEDALPDGWTYSSNGPNGNDFVHIKDGNGNYRVRIDPADKVTNYRHMHLYDEAGNSLDINGNIVPYDSPNAHIPYNK